MPTPVGHALGGWIVGGPGGAGKAGAGGARGAARWATPPTICALAACLPDIDFFWGRHNMETHSVGFAVLVGLAIFFGLRDVRLSVAVALAVGTHVLFDWLGSDDSPPLGVMALWPFTDRFYFADAFVFEAISRRYWLPGFLMHNLLAVLREVAILGPIALVVWRARRGQAIKRSRDQR